MNDINEIKEALAKITPGIWWHYQSNNSVVSDHKDLIWGRKTIAECNSFDDAKLLANAPEWISSLITTIESQQNEIAFLEGSLHFHRTRDTAKEITAKAALIESQKEEIKDMKDDFGVVLYELNRLEVQLDLPKRGYLRNSLENLMQLAKTHNQEGISK